MNIKYKWYTTLQGIPYIDLADGTNNPFMPAEFPGTVQWLNALDVTFIPYTPTVIDIIGAIATCGFWLTHMGGITLPYLVELQKELEALLCEQTP